MSTVNSAPQYLVITAIGQNKTGLVSELTGLVYQCDCNVVDSKMAIFANEFSIIMLLEGGHTDLLRLESQLPGLAMELNLLTMIKRTHKRHIEEETHGFVINIEGPDKAGTIKEFTSHLAQQGIDIASLKSNLAEKNNKMFQSAQIEIALPGSMSVEEFEPALLKLCDKYEMTCVISPVTIESIAD